MLKKIFNSVSILFVTTLIVVAAGTVVVADEWNGYDDVSEDDAHYEGIKSLTEQGVLSGYETNEFKPWENISRQHAAVILSKVTDFEKPDDLKKTLDVYQDVDENHRYALEIATLTKANIFKGDTNEKFNPDDHITRQQLASVLVLALDLEKLDKGNDVDINLKNVSESHRDNVQIIANLGLTNQLDDFRAYEPISRAATATFVHKAQFIVGGDDGKNKTVTPGVEVLLDDHLDWLEDKRVGLITNPTGITRDFESTIDVLYNHPDINLTALFGPEHGIRGDEEAGGHIDSYIDEKTGLPVYSLYGSTWKPTEDMLEEVDVLLFDMQDIDSNVYTYIYTLGFAIEAAAEQDKELIVLDRPNPISGTKVEGPVRSEEVVSYMGRFLLPVRHGMTVGELALMWNHEYSLGANVKVAEMKDWNRTMHFGETGLPWVMTSPNIPTRNSAYLYAGTELLADTNLSVGLGTTKPFELVGAPWIDAEELAEEMESRDLTGVKFRPAYFTPMHSSYEGELVGGVEIYPEKPAEINLIELGLNLIDAMREQNPEKFKMTSNNAIGTPEAAEMIEEGQPVEDILASWKDDLDTWNENVRSHYLLYPPYSDGKDGYESTDVLGILPLDLSAAPGETIDLTVIGHDKHGVKKDIDPDNIKWEVSGNVGYIKDGVFHAEEEGIETITATYDGFEAERKVDVSSTYVNEIRHGVHSDHTRLVFDLNKTIDNYEINEKDKALEIRIPYGEIVGDLDKEGDKIDIDDSAVLTSIEYSQEEDEFVAVLNLSVENIEYATPKFSSRLVIDLKH